MDQGNICVDTTSPQLVSVFGDFLQSIQCGCVRGGGGDVEGALVTDSSGYGDDADLDVSVGRGVEDVGVDSVDVSVGVGSAVGAGGKDYGDGAVAGRDSGGGGGIELLSVEVL
jgi:hypothetical protein